ncbi:MAG: tyrosine-protein phosphatase [Levilactobacillus sp.]|uniref:tyrosine-protein phosphatase n=1 Tax=Levilactobacillus sp. TaxID=2767919 RepID=UPI002584AD03|nr:tyrosine-protein phosphatase [Levilactobacillus sp.]MCI1553122.1 tyrosine-protein phosphatase [Levilactobacillus sp.]MCI1598777.1 tyrosine-protein phosphatase [Levilactobacillus sp.]MCI1605181.1 tyrosine-protein phosphatase [Levilactobacillus sp.]
MKSKLRLGLSVGALIMTLGLGAQTVATPVQAATHATTVQAGKQIKLQGAENVRDLGGYRTKTGKTVKRHVLLRAAALNKLTKADAQKLKKVYHVRTDVDLRSKAEAAKAPDVKISGVTYKFDPVVKDVSQQFSMTSKDGVKIMENGYKAMVTSVQGKKAYKQLFKILLKNPKGQAVLWHCTAGKDRTGIGTALVLSALGVSRKTVMSDYLLSNKYLAASNKAAIKQLKDKGADAATIKLMTDMMVVKKSYLNAAFSAINKKYGSVDKYLQKGLGLTKADRTKLQKLYLK